LVFDALVMGLTANLMHAATTDHTDNATGADLTDLRSYLVTPLRRCRGWSCSLNPDRPSAGSRSFLADDYRRLWVTTFTKRICTRGSYLRLYSIRK
jgi:hypothetical protein